VISDTPVVTRRGLTTQDVYDAQGLATAALDEDWPEEYPSVAAFQAFAAYVEGVGADQFVTIKTTLAVYEQMKIIRFRVERDATKGNALHFNLTARGVRLVSTSSVAVPVPAVATGKKKKNVGKKYVSVSNDRRSFAYGLLHPGAY
jgi:hypothetical protein